MNFFFTLFLLFFTASLSAQTLVDFEEFNLPNASFLNGSDGSGGFSSGNIFLPNDYNTDFMSWSGWAISNITDTTTRGFTNQYSAIAGGGVDGSAHYATTYAFGNNNLVLRAAAAGQPVSGMYVTNSTYTYWSMLEGDAFAKKFGGLAGQDPDFFLLTIKAFYNGSVTSDSVNFYLADYRFADNSQDYIIGEWTWVDLSALGPADSLSFELSSSDVGQFGMNTPAFFCIDNIFATDPLSSTTTIRTASSFDIYPNPSADHIWISHTEDQPVDCFVFNTYGQLLQQSKIKRGGGRLSLDRLPAGHYIVKIQGKQLRSSKILTKI